MPRFNSTSQVASGFLVATVVSIGLIFLIKAEVRSRRLVFQSDNNINNNVVEGVTVDRNTFISKNATATFINSVSKSLKSSLKKFYENFLSGIEKLRSKRSDSSHSTQIAIALPWSNNGPGGGGSGSDSSNKIRHGRKLKIDEGIIKQEEICYKTDDVLIVVALTCFLNFTFILFIWGFVTLVKIFFNNSNKKHKRKLQDLLDSDDSDFEEFTPDEKPIFKKSHSMEELSRWEF